MQAIHTKVIPATNTKPTRILAKCARGKLYFSTTHLTVEVGSDEAHRQAAAALSARFVEQDAKTYGTHNNPWAAPFITGTLPDGSKCHVFAANYGNAVLIEFADTDDHKNFISYRERAQKQDGTVSGLYAGLMCSAIKRSKI